MRLKHKNGSFKIFIFSCPQVLPVAKRCCHTLSLRFSPSLSLSLCLSPSLSLSLSLPPSLSPSLSLSIFLHQLRSLLMDVQREVPCRQKAADEGSDDKFFFNDKLCIVMWCSPNRVSPPASHSTAHLRCQIPTQISSESVGNGSQQGAINTGSWEGWGLKHTLLSWHIMTNAWFDRWLIKAEWQPLLRPSSAFKARFPNKTHMIKWTFRPSVGDVDPGMFLRLPRSPPQRQRNLEAIIDGVSRINGDQPTVALLFSLTQAYITASLKILAEMMESKNKVCRTALANLTASQRKGPWWMHQFCLTVSWLRQKTHFHVQPCSTGCALQFERWLVFHQNQGCSRPELQRSRSLLPWGAARGSRGPSSPKRLQYRHEKTKPCRRSDQSACAWFTKEALATLARCHYQVLVCFWAERRYCFNRQNIQKPSKTRQISGYDISSGAWGELLDGFDYKTYRTDAHG